MSALLHTPLSAQAETVEPSRPMEFTTERFSRTLEDRHPGVRSSTAHIVPMDAEDPMHPDDVLSLSASVLAALALFVIYLVEWYLS